MILRTQVPYIDSFNPLFFFKSQFIFSLLFQNCWFRNLLSHFEDNNLDIAIPIIIFMCNMLFHQNIQGLFLIFLRNCFYILSLIINLNNPFSPILLILHPQRNVVLIFHPPNISHSNRIIFIHSHLNFQHLLYTTFHCLYNIFSIIKTLLPSSQNRYIKTFRPPNPQKSIIHYYQIYIKNLSSICHSGISNIISDFLYKMSNKTVYKTYCFQHLQNIMYFYYNFNHPILTKNIKFQLGKVKIFTQNDRVFSCQITSNPHLNLSLDWNEEFFTKLFHGLSKFQLEGSGDQDDSSLSLVARDHFQANEQIFLMRAKLSEQFGYDITNQFWHIFKNFNQEKMQTLDNMNNQNLQSRRKANQELERVERYQNMKQKQKKKLQGQLSALLREKVSKLKEFGENFEYIPNSNDVEPSDDLSEQKDSMSIAGSLFMESQEFQYHQ